MATSTEKLGLILPDATDYYDVSVQNHNMELLDAAIAQTSIAIHTQTESVKSVPVGTVDGIVDNFKANGLYLLTV